MELLLPEFTHASLVASAKTVWSGTNVLIHLFPYYRTDQIQITGSLQQSQFLGSVQLAVLILGARNQKSC